MWVLNCGWSDKTTPVDMKQRRLQKQFRKVQTTSATAATYRVSHLVVYPGWVGLTLIWMYDLPAQLLSPFCQIPIISPGRKGQAVEH